MSELVEFLRARIAEDAAEIAKHPDGQDEWEFMATGEANYPCTPYLMIGKKRALAEVAAKRRLIELYDECDRRCDNPGPADPAHLTTRRLALGEAVALLVLPNADHEDYRAEWVV